MEEFIYKSEYEYPDTGKVIDKGFVQYMFSTFTSPASKSIIIDAYCDKSLTGVELCANLHSISHSLVSIFGIKQGDVVMVMSGNTLYVPVIFMSVLYIGAIITTMNPVSTVVEISKQINDAKPKLIFITSESVHKVKQFNLPFVIIEDHTQDYINCIKLNDALPFDRLLEGDPSWVPDVDIMHSDTAVLLYSSGTTGLSKGVMLSHGNMIAASECMNISKNNMSQDNDVIQLQFPFFHTAGFSIVCYNVLRMGPTLVFLRKYDIFRLLRSIEKYEVTRLIIAPPVVLDMLNNPTVSEFKLNTLKYIHCGAAPLGKDTMQAFLQRFPTVCEGFVQGYGMTEATFPISGGFGPIGAAGKLSPSYEAKVIDLQTGKSLPPGHKGELYIRSPCIMQGYLNNPDATAAAKDRDGWLHTGDLVYFNKDGYVFVVDRIKELIKYKGYQVAPAELESLLLTHKHIADCAVVPFPDERAGQIPVAYIVRVQNSNLTGEQVMEFVASQVSPYKKIRKVIFVDFIPKSPTGKILRKELSVQSKL